MLVFKIFLENVYNWTLFVYVKLLCDNIHWKKCYINKFDLIYKPHTKRSLSVN